jgi:AcrR family transcriptional regulator
MLAKEEANPRIPKQQRGIETRERIVMAALELFAENGYHRTNAKQIAARAGVAVGSFYAYFKDKKDLFKAALEEYARVITGRIASPRAADIAAGDPEEFLASYMKQVLRAHSYYPGFHREALRMRQEDPDVRKILELQERKVEATVLRALEGSSELLQGRDLGAAAFLVRNAVESTIHGIVYGETKLKKESLLRELTSMILRYLSLEGRAP